MFWMVSETTRSDPFTSKYASACSAFRPCFQLPAAESLQRHHSVSMISPHVSEEKVATASVRSVFGRLMRELLLEVISITKLR